MATYSLRYHELKRALEDQSDLGVQIDKFIRLTRVFIEQKYAIALDYREREKLKNDLDTLRRKADALRHRAARRGRFKLKRHERRNTHLYGLSGNLRGESRKQSRQLDRLIEHLKQLREAVNLFRPDNQAIVLTEAGRALDNYFDPGSGTIKVPPGGELVLGVTIMLAALAKLLGKE